MGDAAIQSYHPPQVLYYASRLQEEDITKRVKGRWSLQCFITSSVTFAERRIINEKDKNNNLGNWKKNGTLS